MKSLKNLTLHVARKIGLKASQVRVLTALKSGREVLLKDLKVLSGAVADETKKYTSVWLDRLNELHSMGLIDVYEVEPADGLRRHNLYSITAKGRKMLEKAREAQKELLAKK